MLLCFRVFQALHKISCPVFFQCVLIYTATRLTIIVIFASITTVVLSASIVECLKPKLVSIAQALRSREMRSSWRKSWSCFFLFFVKVTCLLYLGGSHAPSAAIFSTLNMPFPFISSSSLFSLEENKLKTTTKQENKRQDPSCAHVVWLYFALLVAFVGSEIKTFQWNQQWTNVFFAEDV